jgi:pre-mRNA-splicing factor CWC26
MEWGKGKVQKQQKIDKWQAIEEEKNKPFARSINDEALNDMWKDQDRWGDPMARLVKKVLLSLVFFY